MREFVKVTCVVVLMFGAVAAGLFWIEDHPTGVTWALRIGLPLLCVAAIAIFLRIHFQKDEVRDYLRQLAGKYFNRKGFCFVPSAERHDGVCYLTVYFQNQQDQPCIGRIAIRPAPGFLMQRPAIPAVLFEVRCEAAGFGLTRMAIPLPPAVQGKRQNFEVGASVDYFQGRGRTVRFRDGTLLSTDCDFTDARQSALTAGLLLTGHLSISLPVRTKISLPSNVATELAGECQVEVQMLWKLGDPPLKNSRATESAAPGEARPFTT